MENERLLARIEERQKAIMEDVKQIRDDLHAHIGDDRNALSTIYEKINTLNVESSGQFGKIKGVGVILAIAIPIVTTILITVITYILNHLK